MERTVIGVFRSRDELERAIQALRERGFRSDEVSVLARDDRDAGRREQDTMMGTPDDDLSEGVTAGGILGGLAGLLAGVGALAIPGVGPIIAAGPVAGVLTGAVTGGVAGGLIDWGIPEERGQYYEGQLREGNMVALVKADQRRIDEAQRVLRDSGARDIESHDAEG